MDDICPVCIGTCHKRHKISYSKSGKNIFNCECGMKVTYCKHKKDIRDHLVGDAEIQNLKLEEDHINKLPTEICSFVKTAGVKI